MKTIKEYNHYLEIMNRKKRLIIGWSLISIALILALITGLVGYGIIPVEASGTTSLELIPQLSEKTGYYADQGTQSWAVMTRIGPANCNSSNNLGWATKNDDDYLNCYTIVCQYDLSSLPADAEIQGIDLKYNFGNKLDDSEYSDFYFTAVVTDAGSDETWTYDDIENWYHNVGDYKPIVVPQQYSNVSTDTTYTCEVDEEHWDYVTDADGNDMVYIQWVTYRHYFNDAPVADLFDGVKYMYLGAFDVYYSHLVIDYVETAPPRDATIDDNDDIDTTILGDEEATALGWITPRCAYADEDIGILVTGDSGAPISLVLQDEAGAELETKTDSVRVDGYYRWTINLPDSYEGYIRAIEETHNLTCTWGYVMPRPDTTQLTNYTYARYTDYPQYETPWADYRVDGNDIMIMHYKTNIDGATELGDFEFNVWYLGDSDDEIYSETLDDIADNYYLHTETDNDAMCHWRYLLMVMDGSEAGFEDYDGLIITNDIEYEYITSGFYQHMIYETGVGEFTTTHSAYWYNDEDTDGVYPTLNDSSYSGGEEATASVHAGSESHVKDELSALNLSLIMTNTVVDLDDVVVGGEENQYSLTLPASGEDCTMRFTFTGDGSFTYIRDLSLTIEGETSGSGTAGKDYLELLKDTLGNLGLDNSGGHFLVIFLLMILCFILAYKDRVLRVVLPLCVLGFGVLAAFIDLWIVILLGIIAGGIIFAVVRKRVAGGV